MDKVITIIFNFLKNPNVASRMIRGQFGKFVQKYISQDILMQYTKYKNFSKLLDPHQLLKAMKRANINEVNELMKEIAKLNKELSDQEKKQNQKNIEEFYKKKEEFYKKKSENNEQMKEALKGLDESTGVQKLSSSWVKYGKFRQMKGSNLGFLTIWIKSDSDKRGRWYGPYTYPYIDKNIWISMRAAQGKNGNGAGSVMWKLFLRDWLPSQLRAYIKKPIYQKKMNAQAQAENEALINRLSSRYTRIENQELKKATNRGIFETQFVGETRHKLDQSMRVHKAQQQLIRQHYDVGMFTTKKPERIKTDWVSKRKAEQKSVQTTLYKLDKGIKNAKRNVNKSNPIKRAKKAKKKFIMGFKE